MTLGFKANIAPELRVFAVQLDSVKPHPDNARKHRLDKLMVSLEAHGQRALIIVQQSTGHIVKGNGTWAAAKQLGWTQIAVNRQELTDSQALAFLYADNRASDLSGYDRDKHVAGLRKLVDGPGLMGTLWSEDEWADLDESMTPATVIAPDSDAAYTHQFSEQGETAQAKRETNAQSDQERLKDVRFPLTLTDHSVFVERLKVLQRRYGTAGAIATIIETVKRQAEAEGSTTQTGRQLEAEAKAAVQRALLAELRSVIESIPSPMLTGSQVIAIIDQMTPPAPKVAPDVLPGQQPAFPELAVEDVARFGDAISPEAATYAAGQPDRTDTAVDSANETQDAEQDGLGL